MWLHLGFSIQVVDLAATRCTHMHGSPRRGGALKARPVEDDFEDHAHLIRVVSNLPPAHILPPSMKPRWKPCRAGAGLVLETVVRRATGQSSTT